MKKIILLPILLLVIACDLQNNLKSDSIWIASAPSGDEVTKIEKLGKTVIPNGRYITPAGLSFLTAPHPYGLTLSPDGNIAVTANSGTNPLSITIVRDILSQHSTEVQVSWRSFYFFFLIEFFYILQSLFTIRVVFKG